MGMIDDELGLPLNLRRHELGFILPSLGVGIPSMYSAISGKDSELSQRSALSAMYNCHRLEEGEPTLTLYLWDPIPSTPIIFPLGSDVADTVNAKRTRTARSLSTPKETTPIPPTTDCFYYTRANTAAKRAGKDAVNLMVIIVYPIIKCLQLFHRVVHTYRDLYIRASMPQPFSPPRAPGYHECPRHAAK